MGMVIWEEMPKDHFQGSAAHRGFVHADFDPVWLPDRDNGAGERGAAGRGREQRVLPATDQEVLGWLGSTLAMAPLWGPEAGTLSHACR